MAIPQSVRSLLEADRISYRELDESREPRSADSIAKVLLLHARGYEVQVFIAADCMLDLLALNETLASDCKAFSSENLRQIYDPMGLQTIPAIPALTHFRTLVDDALLNLPVVHIQSGRTGKLLRLEKTEFVRLLGNIEHAVVAVPVSRLVRTGGSYRDDIEQINAAIHSRTRLKIQERLDQTLELPPLPASARKILELRAQEDPNIDDLLAIVEQDAPLAAKVIGYASSPFFGVGNKLTSVREAIVRVLGFERVMNLALGLAMNQTLTLPEDAPQDALPYFEQSVLCATLVDRLGRKLPQDRRPEPGLAYLAGLLHNFGHLLVAHVFPEEFSLACRYIEASPHVSHGAVERHLLSVTRQQLASTLLRSWKVPDSVCSAIRYQESAGFSETHFNYANLLYVANALIGAWATDDRESHAVPNSVWERLGLSASEANAVAQEVFEGIAELQETARQIAS